ncbi:hypothetical protein [Carboxylicivirga marina]|uniref:hypothetical protein n=1 Tax=Carboxylicivirga marina TaxID=2800988 RepID=UPI0025919295|nr:hypothetical protein [uncultured Carboxylicivirga sp.]
MSDKLLTISKIALKSIFTAKRYDTEILEEDLSRIMFIRNYIDECTEYVKENGIDINTEEYISELKNYALELFLIQCEEAIPPKEKNSKGFNLNDQQVEDAEYFNYIYNNLEYPE